MVATIQWIGDGVAMIDQTRLPREQVVVTCRSYQEVAESIRSMVIRGAPAIGVAAAMGIALGVRDGADFETVCETLSQTRPTAVNLFWAIDRMRSVRESILNGGRAVPAAELARRMQGESEQIRLEEIA